MFQSKTALVTGSTSGIGLAVANSLAEKGANLILHGLLEKHEGDFLAKKFEKKYAIACQFSNADLRSESSIEGLVESCEDGIDVLVNNAGIQYTETVERFPVNKWNDIIAINLSAAFHTTRFVLPAMQSKGWGRIVNIASVHGLVASTKKAAYCAAKHGLLGLTKVVALENANCGITANAICPGWVDTELISSQIKDMAEREEVSVDEARESLIKEKQAMLAMTSPQSIAELVVYLCSEHARTITGSSLPIDGAWTAQ